MKVDYDSTFFGDIIERIDAIFLKGMAPDTQLEEGVEVLDTFCRNHGGHLVELRPFNALTQTWQWQEQILSQLVLSEQKFSEEEFWKDEEKAQTKSIFNRHGKNSKQNLRNRSPLKASESCRSESLDTYQHLSFDGFAHSWIPSYSTLSKKIKDRKVTHSHYYALLDTLCKNEWQSIFKCKAGKIITNIQSSRNTMGRSSVYLQPLKKKGTLELLYSHISESWCLQWHPQDCSSMQGLTPLSSNSNHSGFMIKFSKADRIMFRSVTCNSGNILGVHLLSCSSILRKRQANFFWLQESFQCEYGCGSRGLAKKLEELVHQNRNEVCKRKTQSEVIAKKVRTSSPEVEIQLRSIETAIMDLVSTSPSYSKLELRRKGKAQSHLAEEDSEHKHNSKEQNIEDKYLSWTAQLDAELGSEEQQISQLQVSHSMGKHATTSARFSSQKTDIAGEKPEDSVLFELD